MHFFKVNLLIKINKTCLRHGKFSLEAIKNKKLQKRFGLKSVPHIFYWEPGYYKTDADVKKYKGEKTIDALVEMVTPLGDKYIADKMKYHAQKPESRWGEQNAKGTDYESEYDPT